jgi:hypothetical protein
MITTETGTAKAPPVSDRKTSPAGFGALFQATREFGVGTWLAARGSNPEAVDELTATGTGIGGGTRR